MLEPQSGFEVVAEAANGLEALWQAKDLQPELILMDIDLPGLNGLEAARRISVLSAKSKILFTSEDDSAEAAQKAFDAGAVGYLIKSDAGTELGVALKDVVAGRRYVSRRLARHKFRYRD
jgi:DNA-binding NarL/FixJ family response regulator